MNRSTSNSGGSSSGSGTAGGVVGSSVAPPAYGIPFMEQPQSVPTQSASMSQGDLHICFCLLCFISEPLVPCLQPLLACSWFACVSAFCRSNSGLGLLLCHIVAFTVHSPGVDLLAYPIVMPRRNTVYWVVTKMCEPTSCVACAALACKLMYKVTQRHGLPYYSAAH